FQRRRTSAAPRWGLGRWNLQIGLRLRPAMPRATGFARGVSTMSPEKETDSLTRGGMSLCSQIPMASALRLSLFRKRLAAVSQATRRLNTPGFRDIHGRSAFAIVVASIWAGATVGFTNLLA